MKKLPLLLVCLSVCFSAIAQVQRCSKITLHNSGCFQFSGDSISVQLDGNELIFNSERYKAQQFQDFGDDRFKVVFERGTLYVDCDFLVFVPCGYFLSEGEAAHGAQRSLVKAKRCSDCDTFYKVYVDFQENYSFTIHESKLGFYRAILESPFIK